ncbi:MAG: hypothetical protein ACE5EK_08120 [Nitrospinales bacterium]
MTVTPPLFQITVGPGEFWSSSLKVVNANSYDLTLYARVMNFEAEGEEGRSRFTPVIEDIPEMNGRTLASWVNVSEDPITVPIGKSGEIPFSLNIPEDAEPGGHYAAILVGTQPVPKMFDGPVVNVSSFVSSLLFLRVEGDVIEEGRVRQFTSEKSLYQVPEASFILKFENLGNVHLKPQGDIVIYNMWGKERGRVVLDSKSGFGNVLPDSTRKFEFEWKGEGNVFDIGKYSAVTTLTYGEDSKKNVSAKTYFWVVPIKPIAIGSTILIFFVFSMFWFIRRYIRRAMNIEKERFGIAPTAEWETSDVPQCRTSDVLHPAASVSASAFSRYVQPIKDGVVDAGNIGQPMTFWKFLKKYALFFVFLVVLFWGIVGIWFYFSEVLEPEREFEIEVQEIDDT